MGNYLAETIESVLSNLRPGDEYFLIDGGSTDNSIDVIQEYAPYLSGWVSEADNGYADAIAKGFRFSKAGYQCWINCGDLLLPKSLQTAREILDQGKHDLIFGDDFYIDEQGRVLQLSNGEVKLLPEMMLYGGWTPLQDACYWRRDLYERVGGIDTTLRYAADYDLFLRMSLAGQTQYVPVVFSAFRRHAGQTSNLYANGYQLERELCRKRELSLQRNGSFDCFEKQFFYWIKSRFRARFQHRKKKLEALMGENISEIECQRVL